MKSIIRGLVDSMETHDNGPVMSDIPNWMMKSEFVGYMSMILGLCFLIAFACIKNPSVAESPRYHDTPAAESPQ